MKQFLPFLFFCLFTLITKTIVAQNTLSGIVIDEEGNNLTGANILLYQDDEFISGTAVDKFGKFSLTGDFINYKIKLSYLGYKDLEISSEDFLFDNLIIMEESTYDLNEIVVTAYRSSTNSINVCGAFRRSLTIPETSIKITSRKWNFYPNPTHDWLKIDVDNEMTGTIEIINGLGKVIAAYAVNGKSLMIDFRNYIDGTYYLRYNFEGQQVENIGKLVKIK